MKKIVFAFGLLSLLLIFSGGAAHAQQMGFTYQGNLRLSGAPANGTFDFQFALFDNLTGGNQVTIWDNVPAVPVANGNFTVLLDSPFGLFLNGSLYMEIRVRPAGAGGAFTTLAPRQIMTSVPSAMRSFDSLRLGGVLASQYVQTGDARLSDARTPLPGSNSYIQNSAVAQAGNFNISGTGAANILSANEFFFGENKLMSNGGQLGNLFFGILAGQSNTSGNNNLFVGTAAGSGNTTGNNNSFFGALSGSVNSTGSGNTFIGRLSGLLSATGSNNTALGFRTSVTDGLTNATALGSQASVTQSNSLVLGSINGVNFATADTNVGIGTTAPSFKLQVVDQSNTGLRVQTNAAGGTVASFGGNGVFQIDAPGTPGGRLTVLENGNVGVGTNAPTARLQVDGSVRVTNGAVYITNPNTVIITSPNGACWGITVNNSGQLSTFPVNPCP